MLSVPIWRRIVIWFMNNNLETMWKESFSPNLIHYIGITLEGLRKSRKTLFRIIGAPIEFRTEHSPYRRQKRYCIFLGRNFVRQVYQKLYTNIYILWLAHLFRIRRFLDSNLGWRQIPLTKGFHDFLSVYKYEYNELIYENMRKRFFPRAFQFICHSHRTGRCCSSE